MRLIEVGGNWGDRQTLNGLGDLVTLVDVSANDKTGIGSGLEGLQIVSFRV